MIQNQFGIPPLVKFTYEAIRITHLIRLNALCASIFLPSSLQFDHPYRRVTT
jgi:hypothetical protein